MRDMDIESLRERCQRSLHDAAFIEDRAVPVKCNPQTILALIDENDRLRKSLDRQCDNMAFVLNHAELYRWRDKFDRELTEDRTALAARLAQHEDAER